MPPFIALAVAGVAVYAGYRLIAKGLEQAAAANSRSTEGAGPRPAEPVGQPKDLGALEWDPATGVYRPRSGGPA
jgi:hypothetical protein